MAKVARSDKKKEAKHLQPFYMRFSKDNAKKLRECIEADCKRDGRKFNAMIERILVIHYGINEG